MKWRELSPFPRLFMVSIQRLSLENISLGWENASCVWKVSKAVESAKLSMQMA